MSKIKQHIVPKFMVRNFFPNEKYNYFNIKEKSIGIGDLWKNDILYEENYYEHDEFEYNEIENKLAEIEDYIAKIYKKIILAYETNQTEIILTWAENYCLRINKHLHSVRSKNNIEKKKEKDGDWLFNSINKDKTIDQIKNEQIKSINIIYKVFIIIKNEDMKNFYLLKEEWHDVSNMVKSIQEGLGINEFIEQNNNFISNNESLTYRSIINDISNYQTKILFFNSDDNFILSETLGIQDFYDYSPLITFEHYYIHPKIMIANMNTLIFYFKDTFKLTYNIGLSNFFKNEIMVRETIKKIDKDDNDISSIPITDVMLNKGSKYIHQIKYIDTKNRKFKSAIYNVEIDIIPLMNALTCIHSSNYYLFVEQKDQDKIKKIIDDGWVTRVEEENR